MGDRIDTSLENRSRKSGKSNLKKIKSLNSTARTIVTKTSHFPLTILDQSNKELEKRSKPLYGDSEESHSLSRSNILKQSSTLLPHSNKRHRSSSCLAQELSKPLVSMNRCGQVNVDGLWEDRGLADPTGQCPKPRCSANARERDRTHSVNTAFLTLRTLIPTGKCCKPQNEYCFLQIIFVNQNYFPLFM